MLPEEEILAVEAERKARWDRVAEHMRALVEMGRGGIVDSREAALVLEHVEGLEALVELVCMASEQQAQESKAALEYAVSDLDECRAHLRGVLEELEKARAERDAALARLSEPRSEQSGGVVVVELGVRLGVRVCGA